MIDVTLDFETYFDKDYSLSKKGTTTMSYVRDPRFQILGVGLTIQDGVKRYYTGYYIDQAVDILFDLQESSGVNLIGQNTKFDALILNEHYDFVPSYYSDTMAMSKGLWPHHPSSLDALCKRLWPDDKAMHKGKELADYKGKTLSEIYSGIRAYDQAQPLTSYCNQDVYLTRQAYKLMKSWIPQDELDIIHMTTRMFVEPEFVADIPLLKETAVQAQADKENTINAAISYLQEHRQQFLFKANGYTEITTPKTFSSPKMYPALIAGLGLTLPKKISPSNGKLTWATGKADVDYINFKAEHHEHYKVFRAREVAMSNIAKTRALSIIAAADQHPSKRLCVPLVYYGAHTGRYGGNEGINVQNFQRGSNHRRSLTAPKGKLVYVADSSNIEARKLAWFAGETYLVQQFANGDDTYATLATDIYGYPVNKTTHPGERGVGKVARLGLGYGMGWRTFQRTLRSGPMGMDPVPCDDYFAQKIVNTYRKKHPAIVQCWREADRIIQAMMKSNCNEVFGCLQVFHQCLQLPNGMYLHFPNLRNEEIQTAQGTQYETVYDTYSYKTRRMESRKIYGGKLVENICQALAAAVIKDQMLRIDKVLQSSVHAGQVCLQVHDEIIAIASAAKPDQVMQIMHNEMGKPPSWAKGLPLDSEGGYDYCYSK